MRKILIIIGLATLMAAPAMAERRNKPQPGPNGELPERPQRDFKGKEGKGEGQFGAKAKQRRPHLIPFDLMDADADGVLSKDEFLAAHAKRLDKMLEKAKEAGREVPEERLKGAEERAHKIFAHMDTDESGDLTKEEMQEARKKFMKKRGKDGAGKKGDCKKKDAPGVAEK